MPGMARERAPDAPLLPAGFAGLATVDVCQRLLGRKILVTRPREQAAGLAARIAAEGGEPVVFPLLEIAPARDQGPLQAAIDCLDTYSLAIFISPNAVDYSIPAIVAERRWPDDVQALALGPGGVARLLAHGIEEVMAPSRRHDSETLLELPVLQKASVAGRRVLIFRGNGGREFLSETLRARGAVVDCVACYQRSAPTDALPVATLLCTDALDALTISSSEALRNLFELLDDEVRGELRTLPLFVPHHRIAELATALGMQRVVLSEPTDDGLVASLCAYRGWS